jgi:hypothetical protein
MTATKQETGVIVVEDDDDGGGNIQVRRLFGPTILLQDWDTLRRSSSSNSNGNGNNQHNNHDNHNKSTDYWELFIDLLLVAAASSIADTFKESNNISQFILSYMIIVNGWFIYSYHLSTRFENSSFLMSLILFIYLVGFGWSTANIRDFSHYTTTSSTPTTTGTTATSTNTTDNHNYYEDRNDNDAVQEFIRGATILRGSIYIMLISIAVSLPRARYFCTFMSMIVTSGMIGFFIAYIGTQQENVIIILVGLWIAAITEFCSELVPASFVDSKKMIPVNIEQSQERFNALGLVMMGETVVSITQTFRELVIQSDNDDDTTGSTAYTVHRRYYFVLILSLLLIFMMTLNIFHTSPPIEEHALRRSRTHAVTLMFFQKLIGLPLLAVGVSVKLIVEAVMTNEALSTFGYQCMSFGVGTSLWCNFVIRLLHHGGKRHLRFGNHKHVFGTNVNMDRIAMIWWYTIAILSFVPFIWYLFGVATHDPMTTTLYHSGLVFVLCFMESTFTHSLLNMIPSTSAINTNTAALTNNVAHGEQQPLL